ncbi:hypothetical protein JS530_04300 [Bifidobacterium sp. LC6]|uniref:Uncharacterized protein n=1 Tax=Bifidobacterium colobi TaxID=2809026 RepID=A0ABS5UVH2_9BIFI|nr:hypothetical protein [Bifidobacterium colobi]MBT1174731.1 hypothetical protein [Bifidobacterium colobi]
MSEEQSNEALQGSGQVPFDQPSAPPAAAGDPATAPTPQSGQPAAPYQSSADQPTQAFPTAPAQPIQPTQVLPVQSGAPTQAFPAPAGQPWQQQAPTGSNTPAPWQQAPSQPAPSQPAPSAPQNQPAPWQQQPAPGTGQPYAGQPAPWQQPGQPVPGQPAPGQPVPHNQPGAPSSNPFTPSSDPAGSANTAPQGQSAPGAPVWQQQPGQPNAPVPAGAPAWQQPGQPGAPVPGQPVPGAPSWQQQPGQPGAPVPPGAPGWQQPGQPGAPAPKKKLSQKALIGIIVGAVAAVVIIALVIFMLFKPGSLTTDDYLDTSKQAALIQGKYATASWELSNAISAASGTTTKFSQSDVDKVKNEVKAFDEANTKFTTLKAYQNDEDIKKQFDKYQTKAKKFSTLSNNLADLALPMNKAAKACDDTPTSTMYDSDFYSSYESYINDCSAALDELGKSKVDGIKEYSTSLKDYLTSVGDIIKQMKELGDPNNIEYGTDAYTKMRDLIDKYYDIEPPYDAQTKLYDTLDKLEESSDPSKELNNLTDLIQDKVTEHLDKK